MCDPSIDGLPASSRNKPGPLFLWENGLPLTRDVFITWSRNNIARLGLKGNYSGHSFRIGAATTAAAAGIPDHLIKTLERWLSNAYRIYIRTPPSILDGVGGQVELYVCCSERAP